MRTKRRLFYKPDTVYIGKMVDELPNSGQVKIHGTLEDKNPYNRFGFDIIIPHSFLEIGDKVEITIKKFKDK